jgi:hypothetical protein
LHGERLGEAGGVCKMDELPLFSGNCCPARAPEFTCGLAQNLE